MVLLDLEHAILMSAINCLLAARVNPKVCIEILVSLDEVERWVDQNLNYTPDLLMIEPADHLVIVLNQYFFLNP